MAMKPFTTVVGIDLARRAPHEAVLVPVEGPGRGVAYRAWSVSHDLAGLEGLCGRICQQTGRDSLEGVLVNMEPTSGAWPVVAAYLGLRGAEVCLTRTDLTSQWRKVHSRYRKTDRIDARTLANVPLSFPERVWPVRPVPPAIRVLRELSAQRQRLVEEIIRWKNRFVAAVEPVWAGLLAALLESQRFSEVGRAFFRRFGNPCEAVRYGRTRFDAWYARHAHGLTEPELAEVFWKAAESASALWRTLERRQALPWSPDALQLLIEQDLRLIEFYEQELGAIEARIATVRQEVPECDLLEQMPGVGKVVSVTLASLLLPADRFANTRQCGAYTGFTGRKNSSAGRETEGLRITKTGNRRLKRDLALAANTAMYHDPQLAEFAIRLLKHGKHYNEVRVAVGRKIALRARALLQRAAHDPHAAFQWRDLHGRCIAPREAKALARELWKRYRAEQAKGPSASARSRPSKDASQQTGAQPTRKYARTAGHVATTNPDPASILRVDNSSSVEEKTIRKTPKIKPKTNLILT
jgi:transposase